jgi:hypothetical protein
MRNWNYLFMVLLHFFSASAEEIIVEEVPKKVEPFTLHWQLGAGLGTILDPSNQWQVSFRGRKNQWQEHPFLQTILSSRKDSVIFQATFMATLPEAVGSSDLRKGFLGLNLSLGRFIGEHFYGLLGLGHHTHYLYFANPGKEVDANGATFYKPEKWVFIQQQVLPLTLGARWGQNSQWDFQLNQYTYSLFHKERRWQRYSVALSYFF